MDYSLAKIDYSKQVQLSPSSLFSSLPLSYTSQLALSLSFFLSLSLSSLSCLSLSCLSYVVVFSSLSLFLPRAPSPPIRPLTYLLIYCSFSAAHCGHWAQATRCRLLHRRCSCCCPLSLRRAVSICTSHGPCNTNAQHHHIRCGTTTCAAQGRAHAKEDSGASGKDAQGERRWGGGKRRRGGRGGGEWERQPFYS